jgi:hypothetical protein
MRGMSKYASIARSGNYIERNARTILLAVLEVELAYLPNLQQLCLALYGAGCSGTLAQLDAHPSVTLRMNSEQHGNAQLYTQQQCCEVLACHVAACSDSAAKEHTAVTQSIQLYQSRYTSSATYAL